MQRSHRVKNSGALHRTFNVQPLYLRHENTGKTSYVCARFTANTHKQNAMCWQTTNKSIHYRLIVPALPARGQCAESNAVSFRKFRGQPTLPQRRLWALISITLKQRLLDIKLNTSEYDHARSQGVPKL